MATPDDELLKFVEDATINARDLQRHILCSIVHRNLAADYLRRFLPAIFAGGFHPEMFRHFVPLSSYEDYADLIGRIADGVEPSTALSIDPLDCFLHSSGASTLKPKMIPFFGSDPRQSSSNVAHQAGSALLQKLFPPRPMINKILWFLYAGNVTETKGGFKVMAASSYPFHCSGASTSPLFSRCISPAEVILSSETHQQMYCHLLCGLKDSSLIDGIQAPYAPSLVRALRLLKSKWKQLCDDIENGSVSLEITDIAMRDKVNDFLGAQRPDLAKRIREVCSRDDWCGILRELWPESRYVACVTTGCMEQYYPILKYYAGESLPLLGGDYVASECSIGINIDRTRPPEQTRFVLLPTAAYFEFLPFKMGASSESRDAVDISGVEIGKMYEVVVTTSHGLYRYRLGDVVKIRGFCNSSPLLEFVTRAPEGDSEVFTEKDLMLAMEEIQPFLKDSCKGEVIDYAASLGKPLEVFVEVREGCMLLDTEKYLIESSNILKSCCSLLEDSLGSVYKTKRQTGDVGPVRVSVVKPGTFDQLEWIALERDAPFNQYKPPKILRNKNLVHFLVNSSVIGVSDY